METSLRLVLLVIGCIIIVGIIWDFRKNRRSKAKGYSYASKSKWGFLGRLFSRGKSDFDESLLEPHDEFEEVVIVKGKSKSEPSLGSDGKVKRQTPSVNSPVAPKPEEIILLHILARAPSTFVGKNLIDAFNEAHLFYGDMQVFHRYENMDGSGELMFSLASAVEPGYFEVSKLETLTTPGLTLFFTITTPNLSIEALEMMLRTAKQLAIKLDGEIRDDRRKLLTVQTIQAYRDRVRLESKERMVSSASL